MLLCCGFRSLVSAKNDSLHTHKFVRSFVSNNKLLRVVVKRTNYNDIYLLRSMLLYSQDGPCLVLSKGMRNDQLAMEHALHGSEFVIALTFGFVATQKTVTLTHVTETMSRATRYCVISTETLDLRIPFPYTKHRSDLEVSCFVPWQ